jgi:tape measure domain-containing protein
MATNTLHIRVRSDGTRVVGKSIKSIGESAKVASRQIFIMRRAIQTLFAALGVRAGLRAIEEFTELNNKIKTVTNSTKELTSVRKKLLEISNASRTNLSATVQLYTRTTRAVQKLGLSEQKRLKFTELLTKESIVGGATTIEATNAIRQLTQGMGAAGLKGEELRSVIEQLPTVGERIAEFLGVTQGELRKLGEEGKLTGEVVVAAMLAAEESIEKAFGETTSTVGQAFEVFKNNFVEFMGNLDSGVGLSGLLVQALNLVGNNLKTIIPLLAALAGISAFNTIRIQLTLFLSSLLRGIQLAKAFRLALLGVKTAQVAAAAATVAATVANGGTSTALSAFLANGGVAASGGGAAAIAAGSGLAAALIAAAPAIFATTGAVALLAVGIKTLSQKTDQSAESFFRAQPSVDIYGNKLSKVGLIANTVGQKINRMNAEMAARGERPDDFTKQIGNERRLQELGPSMVRDLDEFSIALNRRIYETNNGGTDADIDRLTQRIDQLRTKLKESIPDTFTNSLDKAALSARTFQGRMQAFVDLLDAGNKFKLTDEELGGDSFAKKAKEVNFLTARLAELQEAYLKDELSKDKFVAAQKFRAEQLDSATGGGSDRLADLQKEVALLKQYGNDTLAIDLAKAGVEGFMIERILEQRNIRDDILTDIEKSARAEQEAAQAVEAANRSTKQKLELLREQIRLFGLSAKAQQREVFLSGNPSSTQVDEFDSLTRTLEQKGISAGIQKQIAEFKASASALNEAINTAKENAAKLGPEKLKEVNENLIRWKDALQKAAVALANSIAADLGTGGDKSIEEVRAALVAGAGTIGTQAGTALVTAFKAAVLGAIPGLNALLPPGVPGGEGSTPEQDAQRDANNQAFQAANNAAKEAADKINQLNETARLFGPTMKASARQGGNALKGFGEEAITLGGEIKTAFTSIFGSLEDALVGFVTTGKLDFKSLITSILADLARMVVRMLIIKPLMGFFGGMFGGIFGFSGGGGVGDAFGLPGFATGGLVSEDPAVASAQKFARGGMVRGAGNGTSDSIPALLSRDEFVVNAAASRPNMAGLNYLNSTGRMPGGRGGNQVNYAPSITIQVESGKTSDANEGNRLGKELQATLRSSFNEMLMLEQRPGGALSKTKDDVI